MGGSVSQDLSVRLWATDPAARSKCHSLVKMFKSATKVCPRSMFPRNVEQIIINLVFKVFHAQQGDLNLSLSAFEQAAGWWCCQLSEANSKSVVIPIVINAHSSAACFCSSVNGTNPTLGMTTRFFPQVRPTGPAQHIAHRGRLISANCYVRTVKNKRDLFGDGDTWNWDDDISLFFCTL